MTEHCAVHPKEDTIETGLDLWVYALEHSKEIDPADPPEVLRTPVMMEVMNMLNTISQKDKDYWTYQGRVNARRDREALMDDYKRAAKQAEAERLERIAAQQKAAAAQQKAANALKQAEAAKQKAEEERKAKDTALQKVKELEAMVQRLKNQ